MKMEENINQNSLVEQPQEKLPLNENDNKISSVERISKASHKNDIPSQSVKINIEEKKPKKRFTRRKLRKINMYIVLIAFLIISLGCLLLSHFVLEEDIKKIIEDNQTFTLLLFIILLIGSLLLSAFASFFECFLNTHFFGIIFFIALNLAFDYCVVYINHYSYFEELFCSLIVLISGSIGLLIITLPLKDEESNSFVLYLFNLLFSVIGGCIMCSIYTNSLNLYFSIIAFIISEFNVYSSQFKFGRKKERKDPMVYGQPFELVISIFKLLYMIFYLLYKVIKFIFKTCKRKERKEHNENNNNNNTNVNQGNNEIEESAVGQEQVGGEVEIHEQAQE